MKSKRTFSEQFLQIDALLTNTRHYWQIMPFAHCELPWSDNQPLYHYLSGLTVEEMARLDSSDSELRRVMSPLLGHDLQVIDDLALNEMSLPQVSPWFKAGIKGRKWQQIERFATHIPMGESPLLEWCAGKGHLGRMLGHIQHRPVTSLEWQQTLCEQGIALADKHQVHQEFIQTDIFSTTVKPRLKAEQHAFAFHACGDLHVELLKQASAAQTRQITIAPCCYHLIGNRHYRPLSSVALRSKLVLADRDLSLSMQKTVVATKRERHHTRVEVAWRLGFDLLQRDIRGRQQYLPLPSIKQSILTGSFSAFCHWACDQKGLGCPPDANVERYEQAGWLRRDNNSRIELVTHAFRQLLERWLLLDRVLFLQQQGYTVELENFCASDITPRNALIKATRR